MASPVPLPLLIGATDDASAKAGSAAAHAKRGGGVAKRKAGLTDGNGNVPFRAEV